MGRVFQGKGEPSGCACWEALGLGAWSLVGSVAGTEATWDFWSWTVKGLECSMGIWA